MVVGEMADPVDFLVVGGGPGGYAAALHAARLGRQVALVERDGAAGLGGTCVRVGCIPSKALIEFAHVRHGVSEWSERGISGPTPDVDMPAFQTWKNTVVQTLSDGVHGLLTGRSVDLIAGVATFNRPNQVAVASPDGNVRFLEFTDAVIATGSRPVELSAFPVDGTRVIDSTGALALTGVPKTMAVLGGGYIGLELGTAYAKLGCKVTIVEALDRILPTVDVAVSSPVKRRCSELGMTLLTGTEAIDLDGSDLLVKSADSERRIPADVVVVAVGRRPNTETIGLAAAGLTASPIGQIHSDDFTRAAPHVAVIGDAAKGPALAHKAMAEAEAAARTLSGQPTSFRPWAIPAVIFSDPEVGLVGLSEQQAREEGMDVAVGHFPMGASGRALTLGTNRGFVRLVADRETNSVVGAQIVGPHASELLGEAGLAIEMGADPADLAATIHPHPTISEGLNEVAAMLAGRPLHAASH